MAWTERPLPVTLLSHVTKPRGAHERQASASVPAAAAPAWEGKSPAHYLLGTERPRGPGGRLTALPSRKYALGACVPLCLGLGLRSRGGRPGFRRTRYSPFADAYSSSNIGVVMLSSGGKDTLSVDQTETVEEAMMRLSAAIDEALKDKDMATVRRARREMQRLQLDKPAATCRLLILEDCLKANAIIRMGDNADPGVRIRAVKKLGRWLRWRRSAAKDLVPVVTALEGILRALRAEPEVAWTAQCSLFHAVRSADGAAQSVREGTRGTVSRLLLNEPSSFPLCLPQLAPRSIEAMISALGVSAVHDFFSQLRSVSLMDPGYGDDPLAPEMQMFTTLALELGRSFPNVEVLSLLGFEDCAMMTFLWRLRLPKLQSLRLTGACQSSEAEQAIINFLHTYAENLVDLEVNVWTETFCEADDPICRLMPMPKVRRLRVRAPLSIRWADLAHTFPALEELIFLYDQDFALNALEILEDYGDLLNEEHLLERHMMLGYRDAEVFAHELHTAGFDRLASDCKQLKNVQLHIMDTSFRYDIAETEERLTLSWHRTETASRPRFRRDAAVNNETRAKLAEKEQLHEEAMMRVVRHFDDPSLNAQFGLDFV